MSVSQTTMLTALWAAGTMAGFGLAARLLQRGGDIYRMAALGLVIGISAFSLVIFSKPVESVLLFRIGSMLIGLGGGMFAVGTMLAAMDLARNSDNGFAIGAWSAVQATALGLALGMGGIVKDLVNALAQDGVLGVAMSGPETGYLVVYHIEIGLLFLCLAAIGPLAGRSVREGIQGTQGIGLADMPG